MNHQGHNHCVCVMICVKLCNVMLYFCMYVLLCYRMLSLLTVFPYRDRGCNRNWKIIPCRDRGCNCNWKIIPCRDRGCNCNWKIIPRRHPDCNCNRQLIPEKKKRTACDTFCRNGTISLIRRSVACVSPTWSAPSAQGCFHCVVVSLCLFCCFVVLLS